jgi:hypothetical protein
MQYHTVSYIVAHIGRHLIPEATRQTTNTPAPPLPPSVLQGAFCTTTTSGGLAACGRDALLASFPCGGSSGWLKQALWVTGRLPWLPWYLGLSHGLHAYAIFLLLNWVAAFAAWRQPKWYRQGGRSVLWVAIRSLLTLDNTYSMLLGAEQASCMRDKLSRVCYGSGRTIPLLLWKTLLCQVIAFSCWERGGAAFCVGVLVDAVHGAGWAG